MIHRPILQFSAIALAAITAAGCTGTTKTTQTRRDYDCPAYKPTNPDAVAVKVSLNNQMIYVMEGHKPLLVTATCVGLPSSPTPKGTFRIYNKIERKRSGSYGYFVNGGSIVGGESSKPLPGSYVGYPMPYWCEFSPAYGFHQGWVWPQPRSHGCLRIHKNVAAKFWALVKIGTPVHIADSQPEDLTLGQGHVRPQDYNDPDPPAQLMVSPAIFQTPAGPLLLDGPPPSA